MGAALLTATTDRAGLRVTAGGAWTAANAGEIDRLIDSVMPAMTVPRTVKLDMGAVSEVDTFGARLLQRLAGEAKGRGCTIEVTGLAERYRGLVDAVDRAGQPQQPESARGGWLERVRSIAEKGAQALVQSLLAFLDMLGAVAFAIARIAPRPRTFHPCDQLGCPEHTGKHVPLGTRTGTGRGHMGCQVVFGNNVCQGQFGKDRAGSEHEGIYLGGSYCLTVGCWVRQSAPMPPWVATDCEPRLSRSILAWMASPRKSTAGA